MDVFEVGLSYVLLKRNKKSHGKGFTGKEK